MAAGLTEQIENRLTAEVATNFGEHPWRSIRTSNAFSKSIKHRKERRRAKADPSCQPEYRRYNGYEW